MEHDLGYYLTFWGIPSLVTLISFFFIRKSIVGIITWLLLLIILILYNIHYWNYKEQLIASQPHGHIGMSANIGYTEITNIEAVFLLLFSVVWFFIRRKRKRPIT